MNRQHMAIVKATYTKKAREAKDYLRYIQHRKGLDGHRATRELYGHEGVMERVQGYELIDNAEKGTVFFRIIINPDPATEDTRKDLSLPEITAQAMQTLATRIARDVPYIAATHADHTPLRHAHILALVKGRLTREDFQALRETATQEALTQRKERDLARGQQQEGGQ